MSTSSPGEQSCGVRVAVHSYGERVRLFIYIDDGVILPLAQPKGKVGIAFGLGASRREAMIVPNPLKQRLPLKTMRLQRMRPTDDYCALVTIRMPPGAKKSVLAQTTVPWEKTEEGLRIRLPDEMFSAPAPDRIPWMQTAPSILAPVLDAIRDHPWCRAWRTSSGAQGQCDVAAQMVAEGLVALGLQAQVLRVAGWRGPSLSMATRTWRDAEPEHLVHYVVRCCGVIIDPTARQMDRTAAFPGVLPAEALGTLWKEVAERPLADAGYGLDLSTYIQDAAATNEKNDLLFEIEGPALPL